MFNQLRVLSALVACPLAWQVLHRARICATAHVLSKRRPDVTIRSITPTVAHRKHFTTSAGGAFASGVFLDQRDALPVAHLQRPVVDHGSSGPTAVHAAPKEADQQHNQVYLHVWFHAVRTVRAEYHPIHTGIAG